MFSAFNPSKWSSGQPTVRRPGSSWGFGALLKGECYFKLSSNVTRKTPGMCVYVDVLFMCFY